MTSLLSSRSRFFLSLLAIPAFAGSSANGINNFHQVSERVYRGGQPTEEGFSYLAKIGVKTVIDLREADPRSKEEESMVTAAGMKYVNVPMTGLIPPTDAEITKILALLEDETGGAVFVHCKRGADRTGAVIASYRIDHDHWDNDKALKEAKEMGMSSFQFPRKSYIRDFQPRTKAQGVKVADATPAPAPATGVLTPAAAPAVARSSQPQQGSEPDNGQAE